MPTTDPTGAKAPAGGFQNNGWYGGYNYYNGVFAPKAGQFVAGNPNGSGVVSAAVNNQTNPNNQAYIDKVNSAPVPNPSVTAPPSRASTNAGMGGNGGGSTGLSMPQAPTFDLVAATNAAYNTPEIQAAQKAITDRQSALATASAGINDNPFYSEATRVGKQAKLTSEANNDIGVQQNLLTSLKADAAIKVAAQQGQYNINNDAYKENLSNFNELVSQGALDNASPQDLANLSVQTGIPTSMIQSIAQASSNKNNPVQIIQSTDDSGNLSILAVDKTGKIVNQTTIAGAGKATKGSGSGGTTPSASTLKADAGTAAKAGKTYQDLLSFFGGQGLAPSDIYKIYTSVNYYKRPPDNVDPKTGLYLTK